MSDLEADQKLQYYVCQLDVDEIEEDMAGSAEEFLQYYKWFGEIGENKKPSSVSWVKFGESLKWD